MGRHLGDDTFDGTEELDRTSFSSSLSENRIVFEEDGDIVITGPEGIDTLRGVERAIFDDKALGFDIEGNGGQTYRLYEAALNRAPDEAGLGYWLSRVDAGLSLESAAAEFLASEEFSALFGTDLTDEMFVDQLYQNILDRAPDQAGKDYWVERLDDGLTRPELLVEFAESTENKTILIAVLDDGFEYIPWEG